MRKFNKFQKITFISFAVTSVLIMIFLLLNTFTHPKVSSISLYGGNQTASIKSQQIKITFNRPIKKENISQFISINPQIQFRELWSANTLILIPQLTLDSQTEYKIKIDKNIQDIYGENFSSDYEYTFKTEVPKFAVIEKKLNSNSNTLAIYNADLTNRQEVITRDNIKLYGINDNFAVIVTENNFANNIELLNRKTNQIKNFNFNNIKVNALSFSTSLTKNEFAYTKQNIEIKENYYKPKDESKIYIYNIDTQSESIFNPENSADDITSLEYSSDGQSLLYKTGQSFYSMAETSNPSQFTSIGRFLAEGNFNYDNTKIVFVSYDPLKVYESSQFLTVFSADRTSLDLDNKNIPVLDPQFKHRSNMIVYAEKARDLESTKGIYKIVQTDLEGNTSDIIESTKFSLELPKLSYDDRYIAMEQYDEISLKDFKDTRSLGFQNKPQIATIVIFDNVSKKIIDMNIKGIDAKWL